MSHTRSRQLSLVAVISILFTLGLAGRASAATFVVDSNTDAPDADTNDGECETSTNTCTLRAAIQQANVSVGADEITIPAMEIVLTSPLPAITDSAGLDISGVSAADTVVNANSSGRPFKIDIGATEFENLKITGGAVASSLSTPGWGGGIFVDGGSLALEDVAVESNTIGAGGVGGGIATEGPLTITDSSISSNGAANGGGIYIRMGGSLVLDGNSVVNNNVANAGSGGGIYLQDGTASIDASTLADNQAEGASGYGGAISQGGQGPTTLSINDTEITGNSSDQTGGAIHLINGTTSITSTELAGNSASQGGAISVSSHTANASLTLDQTHFSSNQTTSGPGGHYGGALLMDEGNMFNATTAVTDSLFTGNSAGHSGGAIHVWNGDLEVENSTFSGNSAGSYGGAVNNTGSGSVSFGNATIAENHAILGGGGVSKLGTSATDPVLENTILANNTAGSSPSANDCHGGITSNGHNILGNMDSCTVSGPQTDDLPGADPQLGLLGDHGGPTQTYALALTSPALDGGDGASSCPAHDQRGYPRPVDGPDPDTDAECDIGAYEGLFLTVEDESVVEGDPPGNTQMPFEFVLPAAAPERVRVDIVFTHGSTSEDDVSGCRYAGTDMNCSPAIVIEAGQTSATFTVKVAKDDVDESDETFSLALTSDIPADSPAPSQASKRILIADGDVEGIIEDDDEAPVGHAREVSLDLRRHLKAKGRVTVSDGFNACRKQLPVKVQKKRPNGKWKTLVTATTDNRGRYKSKIGDKPGTYRALAPKKNLTINNQVHNCSKAISQNRKHRH